MYEKIFGEAFVLKYKDKLDAMRQRFFERFKDKRHCLIQLTEAQDRLFAALDERMPEYRAIQTPTLIMAGAEDRAIPPWVQRSCAASCRTTGSSWWPRAATACTSSSRACSSATSSGSRGRRSLGFEAEPAAS